MRRDADSRGAQRVRGSGDKTMKSSLHRGFQGGGVSNWSGFRASVPSGGQIGRRSRPSLQAAGNRPKSPRDGFARDCPLRHPVAPMLALRDRAGASVGFSVDFRRFPQARSAEPRKEGGAGARRGAVSQRSSREPIFVVRVVHAETPLLRQADGGSDLRPAECCRPGESARGMDPSYIPRMSRIVRRDEADA